MFLYKRPDLYLYKVSDQVFFVRIGNIVSEVAGFSKNYY